MPVSRIMRSPFRVAVVVVLLFAGASAPAEVRSYSLLEHGRFEIDLPDGWHATVLGEETADRRAIRIVPRSAVPLVLLLTPIPVADESKDLERAMQDTGAEILRRMREVAVEERLELVELDGAACRGLYVSATDKTVTKPTAENFKYGSQGVVVAGRVLITFTLLTNTPDAAERAEAMDVVRSARHIPPGN